MHREGGGMRTLVDFIPISIIEEGTDNGGRTLIGQTMRIVSDALIKGGVFTGRSVYGAIDVLYKSGRVQRLLVGNGDGDEESQVDEVARESERKKGIVSGVVIAALSRVREVGGVLTMGALQNHLYTGDPKTGVSMSWTKKTTESMNCTQVGGDGVILENPSTVVRVPNSAEICNILNPEGLVEKIEIARELVAIFQNSPTLLDFYGTEKCKKLRGRWVELHQKPIQTREIPKGKSAVLSVTPAQVPKGVVNYGSDIEHLIWSLIDIKMTAEEIQKYQVVSNGKQANAEATRSISQLNAVLSLRLSERSERPIPPRKEDLPESTKYRHGKVVVTPELDNFKNEYGEALAEAMYVFERLEPVVYIADVKERDLDIVEYVRFAEGVQALYSIGAISHLQLNRIMAEVEFPSCDGCACRKYCSIPNRDRVESSKTSEVKTVKSPGHREKFTNAIIERMRRIRWMRNIPPTEGRDRVLGNWEVGSDGQARPRQTDKAPNPTVPDPQIMDSAEQEEDRLRRSLEDFLEKRESEETSGKSPKKTKSSPTPAIPWSPDDEELGRSTKGVVNSRKAKRKVSRGTPGKSTKEEEVPAGIKPSEKKDKKKPTPRKTDGGKLESKRQQPKPLHIDI